MIDYDILDELTPTELAGLLTINDVVRFFNSFGVTDLIVTKETIIAPTICHNPLGKPASKKLYWYNNSHRFRCYTECSCDMSIYDLYMKIMALNYHEVNFIDAVYYVRQFVSTDDINIEQRSPDAFVSTRDRFMPRKQLAYNEEISSNVLDCFEPCAPGQWLSEGISKAAIEKYDIRYCISQECIIIPHYEYRPQNKQALVGIRCRELNEDRIELYAKYHPLYLGDRKYRHHVSYCPYGLAQQQNAVKKMRRAVIVEGEKSVLKGYTYYGEDSVILAACGLSGFGAYQINMLTKECGVTDICLAFDKEFENVKSQKFVEWKNKLEEQCRKYLYCANMSYIIDMNNRLNQKDSPVDRGKKVFELLYKERISVKK